MRTYGYDYSFALSIDEVNTILTNNLKGTNIELKYTGVDAQSGSTISLDATVGPWQIIEGGQNQLLRFSMPFLSGSMTIDGPLSSNYNLADVTVLIEVSLGWLGSSTSQETSGSGTATQLIFSPTQADNPDEAGYVAVVNILDPEHRLDTVGTGLLRSYTHDILYENREKVNYVFANVFPKPNNVSSWLNPYKWIYYYSSGASYNTLCFLCMLSDKPWPTAPAFDSSALTTNNNATILIAQEAFFKHVVLPAVNSTFPGGNFSLHVNSDESCTIKNGSHFNVETSEGEITATSFKLTTSDGGNGLKTVTSGGGSLKFFFGLADLPNASYSWSCEDTNPLQYKNDNITFLDDPNPITHHDQTIHWYDWALLVVVGITSLPGLISVIVDSINDFSDKVNDIGIGKINSNLSSSVSGSVVNLSNLINWSTEDKQQFTSNSAVLNGALCIYGNLKNL
jgi:hypothetical protein